MGLARLPLPRVVGQRMGLARLLLPKRRLLRVRTLCRLLVLLRRSAGLLPIRDTVQHRLADGSGELRETRGAGAAREVRVYPESEFSKGMSRSKVVDTPYH